VDERLYEEYAQIQGRHWWFAGRRAIVRAVIESRLSPAGPMRICDVGCGTGTNLRELRRFGPVTGVDPEPSAVAYCQSHGEQDVRLSSGLDLPFEDSSFDLITMLDVLEHVDDEAAMLGEARRVLAPGGHLLLTVPAYEWMWGAQDVIAHHKRRYTRPRLLSMLTGSSFEPLASSYFNTLLFAPIAAVRLARRLRPPSGPPRSDFELTEPGLMNSMLARGFGAEAAVLRRASLPFGVSILALGRA